MTTFTSGFFARRAARAGAGLLAAAAFFWFAGAAAADAQCVGDCNGDGTVSINELVVGVNIALGIQPASVCVALQDESGEVNISQLVKGVNNALGSCPIIATPTVTTVAGSPTAKPSAMPTPTNTTAGTPTLTATTGPTSTPTPCSTVAVCGDGCIQEGETCDDGNTMDGDNCPATCVIHSCQASADIINVDVVIQPPAGVTIGVLQVFLRYPDGVVALPGSGSAASGAIVNTPDDAFTVTVNDLDYGVRVIALGPDGLTLGDTPANRLFTAQFTHCQGATAPAATDFHCTVEDAGAVDGTKLTATTTCSVELP